MRVVVAVFASFVVVWNWNVVVRIHKNKNLPLGEMVVVAS
jgi:hypothetical protein